MRSLAAFLLVAMLGFVLGDGTKASAQVVTNTADSGPGTLRSAITNAANGAVITFAPALSGTTITLSNTLTISTNLTIDASALPGGIQINGNHAVQVLNVSSNITVMLNWLAITNGCVSAGIGGAGIYNLGTLTLNQCTLSESVAGVGSGLLNAGGATATVNRSTLSGNSANYDEGGGILNAGALTVNQSTLSGNSCSGSGGGIFSASSISGGSFTILNQCTLSGNSATNGGGIFNELDAILTMTNTIVAMNSAISGGDIYNNSSSLSYGGSNIVQSVTNASGTITGPSPIDAPPLLAPLANYGGPTQTMPPFSGSPAIGAGSVAGNTFATDQRGYPRTLNGLIDIGAVEVSPVSALVTNLEDSGPGSLRQATVFATNGATITFAPNLSGQTITLSNTLTISTNLTIDASALPGGIQINGNGAVEVFFVISGNTVMLNSLTITNGYSFYGAGGILNQATLTLNQCIVSGNSATAGIGGGAIENSGMITMNQCTLANNNVAESNGGAIVNLGVLIANQCTLSGNSADSGGAIVNAFLLTMNECTLSGNSASSEGGGGIQNGGSLAMSQCTLSGNNTSGSGGGIYNYASTLAITNTIIAGNSAVSGGDVNNSYASLTYGGSNLVQSLVNDGGTVAGSTPIANAPNLATLGNYGGPTQTMPPLPGSPAIGAGSVAANAFTTDQRGYPRTQNGLIDIGAVELPTIQFTASPANTFKLSPVQFSGPGTDSDGSAITQWDWSFGDNKNGDIQNPSHSYTTVGNFAPSLTVINNLGLTLAASGPAISTYATPQFQSFTRTSGSYLFSWTTVSSNPAAMYQLQYTTNLATHIWTSLGGVLSGIDPQITMADTSPTNRQRFYRLTAAMGTNNFQETFDPTMGTGVGISYDGGDLLNPTVGIVSGVGTSGSAALQIKCSATNGPNGYAFLAGQWQDPNVSGNTDPNLSDYYLSFDAYVIGDAAHQSGGGFALQIQEGAGANFTTTFPQGQLQTYQAYQGGSDLLVPQSGVWKHFTINLGGAQFQSPNGTNINFNVTGGTWQIIFQLNSLDWGREPQTNSTLVIDNIALTVLTPP